MIFRNKAVAVTHDKEQLTETDAQHMLDGIYQQLHSNEMSDGNFLGDSDDAAFTKLYGDAALEAEGYGEITFPGLATLLSDKAVRRGSFMDLGSGLGRSVLYACLAEGFLQCDGVELSKERAQRARLALSQVGKLAPWASERIRLFNGDMLASSAYFDHDVILANNLLLPDVVQDGIAQHFSSFSKPGTVLFTTKEVPISTKTATLSKTSAGVTWEQGGKDFWFRYVKHA